MLTFLVDISVSISLIVGIAGGYYRMDYNADLFVAVHLGWEVAFLAAMCL